MENTPNPQQDRNSLLRHMREALAADGSLRWNQNDVLNTIIDYVAASSGQEVTEHDSNPESGFPPITVKKPAHYAAMIESSPGSGKTRMMGFIAKQATHLNGADPQQKSENPIKVLLLTPRLNLNRQTLREFDEELDIKEKDVGLYDGTQNATEKTQAQYKPVLVATYQSLGKMIKEGVVSLDPSSPNYRGIVLMDEAHELQSFQEKPRGSLEEVSIASFVNDHQITLLFTGTDDGVSERHFGGQVPTIYSKRLVKAHNQGLTCDPIHPGQVDIKLQEKISTDEEKVAELIDRFSGHEAVIHRAVQMQLTSTHPEMGMLNRYKSLFFVNGVEAGLNGTVYFNTMAAALNLINPRTGKPLEAAHIHAKTSPTERTRIIKDYKDGKIAAIFNDSILTFGFDDREAAVVHNIKMHGRTGGARALASMEQIFTRGTRICDGFAEKPALDGKPYGIDKQALLLTYRPVDVSGQPLDVLTSADLLAGLRMDPKARKSTEPWRKSGDKEDGESPDGRLRDFRISAEDLDVHFDFGKQQLILEEARKKLEEYKQRLDEKNGEANVDKTEAWLSKTDFMSLFKITYDNLKFREKWSELERQFRDTKNIIDNDFKDIEFAIARPKNIFVVSANHAQPFAERLGLIDRVSETEYGKTDAAAKLQTSPKRGTPFDQAWEQLITCYPNPHTSGDMQIGPMLRKRRGWVISGDQLGALGELVKKIETERTVESGKFMSLDKIISHCTGLGREVANSTWKTIRAEYERLSGSELVDGAVHNVMVDGASFTVKFEKRTNSISIKKEQEPAFLALVGYPKELYEKPEEWIRFKEFSEALGHSKSHGGCKALWNELRTQYEKKLSEGNVQDRVGIINLYGCEIRFVKDHLGCYYVHNDCVDQIMSSNALHNTHFTPKNFNPAAKVTIQSQGPDDKTRAVGKND